MFTALRSEVRSGETHIIPDRSLTFSNWRHPHYLPKPSGFKDFSKSLTSYWEWALTPWTVRLYLGCGAGHFQGHECYGKFEPRLSLARPSLRYQRRAAGGRDRLQRSDFERLFSGGYDEHGDYDAATVFLGDTVTVTRCRRCAGVLRFHVVGSRRGGDGRQVPGARAADQRR